MVSTERPKTTINHPNIRKIAIGLPPFHEHQYTQTIPIKIHPQSAFTIFGFFFISASYYSSRALKRMGGHSVTLLAQLSPYFPTHTKNIGTRRCSLNISALFFDGVLVGSGGSNDNGVASLGWADCYFVYYVL